MTRITLPQPAPAVPAPSRPGAVKRALPGTTAGASPPDDFDAHWSDALLVIAYLGLAAVKSAWKRVRR